MAYVFAFLSGLLCGLIAWLWNTLHRGKQNTGAEMSEVESEIDKQFLNMMRYTGEKQHDE